MGNNVNCIRKEGLMYEAHIEEMKRTEKSEMAEVNPRLLHAAIGLSTEIGEICEALVTKVPDVRMKEEFGDCFWYVSLAVDELNELSEKEVTYQTILLSKSYDIKLPAETLGQLVMRLSGEIAKVLDVFKCGIYYNRELSEELLTSLFGNVIFLLKKCVFLTGLTIEDVLKANTAKLRTRYPEGYSDDEANNRDLGAEDKALKTDSVSALPVIPCDEALDAMGVKQLRKGCEDCDVAVAGNANKAELLTALKETRELRMPKSLDGSGRLITVGAFVKGDFDDNYSLGKVIKISADGETLFLSVVEREDEVEVQASTVEVQADEVEEPDEEDDDD